MAKFILSTDSCCDELKGHLKERNIETLSMSFCIDEPAYDHFDSDQEYRDFYAKIRAGAMSTTTQPNLLEITEHFEKIIKNNPGKDIVHLSLSSGLSETFNNAAKAAEDVMKSHPEIKIYAVDSLTATQGQSYLLDCCERNRNNNKSAAETAEYIANIRLRLQHFVIANDLNYLHKGGRLSKASAVVGTMLQIKPIIVFNDKGKLIVFDKVKGLTKALKYMVKSLSKYGKDILNQTLFIASADSPDISKTLKEMILEEYPGANIKIGWIGPVIGSHTGPGALGLVFLGEQRTNKS